MDNEEVTLDHADDEIAASWAEISARMEPEEAAAKPSAETEPPAAELPAEEAPASRARDESGKFTKAPKAEPAPAAAAPAAEAPADQNAPPAAEGARDVNVAPSSWKPAAKAAYANLPPEIKAEIHRRESDFMSGQAQLMPDAQLGKQMKAIVQPYAALMQAEGTSIDKAFQGYINQAATLRMGTAEQKAGMVAQAIKQFGIPLEAINAALEGTAQPPQQQQQQQFHDPRFDQYLAQQEERETQQAIDAINRWQDERDAQGQPLRPFASNVMADMIARVPAVKAGNPGLSHEQALTKAYEDAVWANPETRQLKLNELEAKRREESLRTVNDAKKAASVNVPRRGAPPAAAPAAPFGSSAADQAMRDQARELGLIN